MSFVSRTAKRLAKLILAPVIHIIASTPAGRRYFQRRVYRQRVEATCSLILADVLKRARHEYEEEKPTCATWEQYEEAYRKYQVEYSEFFHQCELWNKSPREIEEFVIRTKMRLFYLRTLPEEVRMMFWDKVKFLEAFPEHIHRRWLHVRKSRPTEFKELVMAVDCIAKPLANSLGIGIFKIRKDDITDVEKLYEQCVQDDILIEECICGCRELQQFHPESLNSIRVVTIGNERAGEVFGAFFRIGVGDSIIDNAHSGGVFATINVETGIIETEAIDTSGHSFALHPDTGVPIKGFRIPEWEKIKETCLTAARKYKGVFIVGWDVVLGPEHEVIFVEGNHGPDFDVMQSPRKTGVRHRLQQVVAKYHGNRIKIP